MKNFKRWNFFDYIALLFISTSIDRCPIPPVGNSVSYRILICIWPGVRKLRIAYHFSLLVDIRLNKGRIFLKPNYHLNIPIISNVYCYFVAKKLWCPSWCEELQEQVNLYCKPKVDWKKINMGDRLKELKERSLKRKELLAKAVRFFGFYWMS